MTNIIKNRNGAPAAFGSVLDQLFPDAADTLFNDAFWGFNCPNTSVSAPVNILETAEGYELQLAAPGLRKSDFQLHIDGDTLTISFGQQKDQPGETDQTDLSQIKKKENTQARLVRWEFTRHAFQRHFELADTLDRERISTRYDCGILYLYLPKKENLRPVTPD